MAPRDRSTAARIVQILQHVEAEHRVEARLHAGEILGDFRIDALHYHVGRAQKAIVQRVQVERVLFGRHVEHAPRHQPAGEIADARADFEHRIAQVRTHACAPANSNIAACR